MTILGIETSCDETALAVLEVRDSDSSGYRHDSRDDCGTNRECRVISSLVHSQADLHSAYGGVYPTLAKREHGKNIVPLFHRLLDEWKPEGSRRVSEVKFKETVESFRSELAGQNPELFQSFEGADFLNDKPPVDCLAVTEGPGLEPALWVGINFARLLGALWNVPVIPINHMEGHIVASLLNPNMETGQWQSLNKLPLPALAFLLSGGHTQLVKVNEIGSYEIIGETLDDAVGEAFDKAARLLGLPYPGGPRLSLLAAQAEKEKTVSPVKLPRPMIASGDLNFSFSGLKTAVLYAVRSLSNAAGKLDDNIRKGLALEFELSVADTLEAKLRQALDLSQARAVIIGGGVAANTRLRERFSKVASEFHIPIFLPRRDVSGDNALMIALAASYKGHAPSSSLKAHGTKSLSRDNIAPSD